VIRPIVVLVRKLVFLWHILNIQDAVSSIGSVLVAFQDGRA
jgi:hypothetical protein